MTTTLQPHQQRVVDEHAELKAKMEKLKDFIEHNVVFTSLSPAEQSDLTDQYNAMDEYLFYLERRISRF